MKKTFQKNLIAASVGLVVGVASVGVSANDIGTRSLLFPYLSTGSTAYSFVSITNRGANAVNPDNGGANRAIPVAMHFSYGMKATSAANSVGCDHADGMAAATANDVMQFEVSGKVDMATLGGEYTGVPAAMTMTSAPYPYAGGANKHGFLIVNGDATMPAGTTLYGEAIVADTATGLITAYSSRGLNTDTFAATFADFTVNNTGVLGGPEVAAPANAGVGVIPAGANHGTNVVTWMATPTVSTRWFVVPLGREDEMTPSASVGGITAGYNMFSDLYVQAGAYDMNENFHSGSSRTDVRCVGTFQRSDLLMASALTNTNRGGTANLVTFNTKALAAAPTVEVEGSPIGGTNVAALATVPHKSLVYKIQTTAELGGAQAISREANF